MYYARIYGNFAKKYFQRIPFSNATTAFHIRMIQQGCNSREMILQHTEGFARRVKNKISCCNKMANQKLPNDSPLASQTFSNKSENLTQLRLAHSGKPAAND